MRAKGIPAYEREKTAVARDNKTLLTSCLLQASLPRSGPLMANKGAWLLISKERGLLLDYSEGMEELLQY